jgi:hypothetical protein
MYNQTKLDIIIWLGMIGSITMIGIAIFAGEFEGTIIGHGDDVKFGTLILDTPGEWWAFFLAQLALGILDVYFWEWVKPYYAQLTNFPHIPIVTNNHGNGESVRDRLLLSAKTSAAFFPAMIRTTLSVIFVNTQIMAVILVQAIKELVIFVQVYKKITDKHKDGMWMSQKKADAFNKKNEDQEAKENSPEPQGDNEGDYVSLKLKRRSTYNNIRF